MWDVPWLRILGMYATFPVLGAVVLALIIGLEPYFASAPTDSARARRAQRDEAVRTDRYEDLKARFATGALIGAAAGLAFAIAVHREERARAARGGQGRP
jgi:uncharacterized membrane protein